MVLHFLKSNETIFRPDIEITKSWTSGQVNMIWIKLEGVLGL